MTITGVWGVTFTMTEAVGHSRAVKFITSFTIVTSGRTRARTGGVTRIPVAGLWVCGWNVIAVPLQTVLSIVSVITVTSIDTFVNKTDAVTIADRITARRSRRTRFLTVDTKPVVEAFANTNGCIKR